MELPSSSSTKNDTTMSFDHDEVHSDVGHLFLSASAVVLLIVAADICLYRAIGFMGPAMFLLVAGVAFLFTVPGTTRKLSVVVLAGMLSVSVFRLAWAGNALATSLGFFLLFAMCLSLRGGTPVFHRVVAFTFGCVPGSIEFINALDRRFRQSLPGRLSLARSRLAEVLLPLAAFTLFGGVFVLANADVVQMVLGQVSSLLQTLISFFDQFSLLQIICCGLTGMLSAGILAPVVKAADLSPPDSDAGPTEAPLYRAFRNTLLVVIVVFAVYLLFELRAFTHGKPPEGFTYSSYAHEGAAWLTVTLALSTLVLSLIFRGRMFHDPRSGKLQKLAWIWSLQNIVLVVAVVNRMWIYVAYNGMTRMRVIGFLGIAAVAISFLLVLMKIRRKADFRWLLHRQVAVAGIMIWLFSVLPVDVLIHRYNVAAISDGNPAPLVQITAHPFDDECLAELIRLCESADPLVRDGIRQILTTRFQELRQSQKQAAHWTQTQWSRSRTLEQMDRSQSVWMSDNQNDLDRWNELTQKSYELYW